MDGKTLLGSYDSKNELGALHSVRVGASEIGVTLAQVATDDKFNETTALPQALALVVLKDAILGAAILYCIGAERETVEARYFISSLPVKVKQFARAVPSH